MKNAVQVKINVHEAKTNFSKLLVRVQMGEEVIISKAGKPVARLAPVETADNARILGSAAGEFQTPDDFNAPLPPEIEDGFWR